jgi:hypothetical protein
MVSAQQEQRMVKSEHASPLLSPASNFDHLNGLLPPLDLSSLPEDFNFSQNLDNYSNVPDLDQPLFSAGLSSTSVDWSHYDGLEFNNDNFASSYSQAPSFTGFDFSSIDQPPLTTTSTSGEISEVEDVGNSTANRPGLLNPQYGSDFDTSDFGGEKDGYRLSTASSYIGMPQAQILASNNVEGIDLDAFLNGVPATNGYLSVNDGLPASSYSGSGKTTQIQYDDNNSFPILSSAEENDPFWMSDFTSSNIAINPGYTDPLEENVWAQ